MSVRSPWILLSLALACSPARDAETAHVPSDSAMHPSDSSAMHAAAAPETGPPHSKLDDALSAAPASISRNAAAMDWPDSAGGKPKELRAGTNGWTCFPSTPTNVGASGRDPMCLDKEFLAWADALMSHKPPRVKHVGLGYMLQGDIGASNTDPYAKTPTADNQWVKSGPHLMVLTPVVAQLEGVPADPENGGPWVMWKGTPYAHIMVPAR